MCASRVEIGCGKDLQYVCTYNTQFYGALLAYGTCIHNCLLIQCLSSAVIQLTQLPGTGHMLSVQYTIVMYIHVHTMQRVVG